MKFSWNFRLIDIFNESNKGRLDLPYSDRIMITDGFKVRNGLTQRYTL